MKITSVDIIKLFKEPSEQCEIAVAGPWHPIIVRVQCALPQTVFYHKRKSL